MFECLTNQPKILVIPKILPQQPKNTLFPYTTLFRSGQAGEAPDLAREMSLIGVAQIERELGPDRARVRSGDRKSTRLNSSHVEISYAVFCLKKKNINLIKHRDNIFTLLKMLQNKLVK